MNQKKGFHRNMFFLAQSAAAMFQKLKNEPKNGGRNFEVVVSSGLNADKLIIFKVKLNLSKVLSSLQYHN
jgi:hypothetical protein